MEYFSDCEFPEAWATSLLSMKGIISIIGFYQSANGVKIEIINHYPNGVYNHNIVLQEQSLTLINFGYMQCQRTNPIINMNRSVELLKLLNVINTR